MSELLDGLLIGDGGIYIDYRLKNLEKWNGKAWFAQSCNSEEYLIYIQQLLEKEGILFGKSIGERKDTPGEYRLTSQRNTILGSQRTRWYTDKGKKIIPLDIELTPTMCLHWYIGDGSLATWKNYLWCIQLNTLAYTNAERELLRNKFISLGISARAYHKGGRVIINRSSVPYFLSFIGESPVEYYRYKWRLDELCHIHPKTQKQLEIDNQQRSS